MMNTKTKRIGVIGCGNISPQYFEGCRLYDNIEIVACADIDPEAARKRAEQYEVPRAMSVEALLSDEEVDIVLNLTTPQFHAPINRRILEAGKHAYCEKPFCTMREEGTAILEFARAKGLRVGCAPDTFLSAPLQTARVLVDGGFIGQPVGAQTAFAYWGHESWHPNPEYYYKRGGGPLLDMGPYYLTALASFFGPVTSVIADSGRAFQERVITSEPLKGSKIAVETPTHYTGLLRFANGAMATTMFSFDLKGNHDLPLMTLYGTEGTLSVPDANRFDGSVKVSRVGSLEWETVPLQHHYPGARALGLAEMAAAIDGDRPHRASGELGYHIFDVMTAYDESQSAGGKVDITTRFDRLQPIKASAETAPQF